MKPLKRLAAMALAIGIGAYLAILAFLYACQRRLEYVPSHRDRARAGDARFRPWLDERGAFLGYVRPGRGSGAVLFFHGNGGEATDREWLAGLVGPERGLFLAEYPGYGGMEGSPSQRAILELAQRQFDAARRAGPVVVVAESLGTGVGCFLASRRPVARLALISPFSSAADVGRLAYPFLPVGLLMKDPFPSVDYVRAGRALAPLMIIHGTDDEVVPIGLGRRLFAAYAGASKRFIEVPGFHHGDMSAAILSSRLAAPFRDFVAAPPWRAAGGAAGP